MGRVTADFQSAVAKAEMRKQICSKLGTAYEI